MYVYVLIFNGAYIYIYITRHWICGEKIIPLFNGIKSIQMVALQFGSFILSHDADIFHRVIKSVGEIFMANWGNSCAKMSSRPAAFDFRDRMLANICQHAA